MGDFPKLLCPQCGHNLGGSSGNACPECGYYVGLARVHHRGAVRHWRFVRSRRAIEALSTLLWLAAFGLGCWLLSFSPGKGFILLTALAGLGVVGLGKYLRFRRSKRNR